MFSLAETSPKFSVVLSAVIAVLCSLFLLTTPCVLGTQLASTFSAAIFFAVVNLRVELLLLTTSSVSVTFLNLTFSLLCGRHSAHAELFLLAALCFPGGQTVALSFSVAVFFVVIVCACVELFLSTARLLWAPNTAPTISAVALFMIVARARVESFRLTAAFVLGAQMPR